MFRQLNRVLDTVNEGHPDQEKVTIDDLDHAFRTTMFKHSHLTAVSGFSKLLDMIPESRHNEIFNELRKDKTLRHVKNSYERAKEVIANKLSDQDARIFIAKKDPQTQAERWEEAKPSDFAGMPLAKLVRLVAGAAADGDHFPRILQDRVNHYGRFHELNAARFSTAEISHYDHYAGMLASRAQSLNPRANAPHTNLLQEMAEGRPVVDHKTKVTTWNAGDSNELIFTTRPQSKCFFRDLQTAVMLAALRKGHNGEGLENKYQDALLRMWDQILVQADTLDIAPDCPPEQRAISEAINRAMQRLNEHLGNRYISIDEIDTNFRALLMSYISGAGETAASRIYDALPEEARTGLDPASGFDGTYEEKKQSMERHLQGSGGLSFKLNKNPYGAETQQAMRENFATIGKGISRGLVAKYKNMLGEFLAINPAIMTPGIAEYYEGHLQVVKDTPLMPRKGVFGDNVLVAIAKGSPIFDSRIDAGEQVTELPYGTLHTASLDLPIASSILASFSMTARMHQVPQEVYGPILAELAPVLRDNLAAMRAHALPEHGQAAAPASAAGDGGPTHFTCDPSLTEEEKTFFIKLNKLMAKLDMTPAQFDNSLKNQLYSIVQDMTCMRVLGELHDQITRDSGQEPLRQERPTRTVSTRILPVTCRLVNPVSMFYAEPFYGALTAELLHSESGRNHITTSQYDQLAREFPSSLEMMEPQQVQTKDALQRSVGMHNPVGAYNSANLLLKPFANGARHLAEISNSHITHRWREYEITLPSPRSYLLAAINEVGYHTIMSRQIEGAKRAEIQQAMAEVAEAYANAAKTPEEKARDAETTRLAAIKAKAEELRRSEEHLLTRAPYPLPDSLISLRSRVTRNARPQRKLQDLLEQSEALCKTLNRNFVPQKDLGDALFVAQNALALRAAEHACQAREFPENKEFRPEEMPARQPAHDAVLRTLCDAPTLAEMTNVKSPEIAQALLESNQQGYENTRRALLDSPLLLIGTLGTSEDMHFVLQKYADLYPAKKGAAPIPELAECLRAEIHLRGTQALLNALDGRDIPGYIAAAHEANAQRLAAAEQRAMDVLTQAEESQRKTPPAPPPRVPPANVVPTTELAVPAAAAIVLSAPPPPPEAPPPGTPAAETPAEEETTPSHTPRNASPGTNPPTPPRNNPPGESAPNDGEPMSRERALQLAEAFINRYRGEDAPVPPFNMFRCHMRMEPGFPLELELSRWVGPQEHRRSEAHHFTLPLNAASVEDALDLKKWLQGAILPPARSDIYEYRRLQPSAYITEPEFVPDALPLPQDEMPEKGHGIYFARFTFPPRAVESGGTERPLLEIPLGLQRDENEEMAVARRAMALHYFTSLHTENEARRTRNANLPEGEQENISRVTAQDARSWLERKIRRLAELRDLAEANPEPNAQLDARVRELAQSIGRPVAEDVAPRDWLAEQTALIGTDWKSAPSVNMNEFSRSVSLADEQGNTLPPFQRTESIPPSQEAYYRQAPGHLMVNFPWREDAVGPENEHNCRTRLVFANPGADGKPTPYYDMDIRIETLVPAEPPATGEIWKKIEGKTANFHESSLDGLRRMKTRPGDEQEAELPHAAPDMLLDRARAVPGFIKQQLEAIGRANHDAGWCLDSAHSLRQLDAEQVDATPDVDTTKLMRMFDALPYLGMLKVDILPPPGMPQDEPVQQGVRPPDPVDYLTPDDEGKLRFTVTFTREDGTPMLYKSTAVNHPLAPAQRECAVEVTDGRLEEAREQVREYLRNVQHLVSAMMEDTYSPYRDPAFEHAGTRGGRQQNARDAREERRQMLRGIEEFNALSDNVIAQRVEAARTEAQTRQPEPLPPYKPMSRYSYTGIIKRLNTAMQESAVTLNHENGGNFTITPAAAITPYLGGANGNGNGHTTEPEAPSRHETPDPWVKGGFKKREIPRDEIGF